MDEINEEIIELAKIHSSINPRPVCNSQGGCETCKYNIEDSYKIGCFNLIYAEIYYKAGYRKVFEGNDGVSR